MMAALDLLPAEFQQFRHEMKGNRGVTLLIDRTYTQGQSECASDTGLRVLLLSTPHHLTSENSVIELKSK